MGLEGVELVMQAEDEFGISIPDREGQQVKTAGEFYDLVRMLIRQSQTSTLRNRIDLESHLWSRIQCIVAQNGYNTRPDEVSRATRFVEDLGYG